VLLDLTCFCRNSVWKVTTCV